MRQTADVLFQRRAAVRAQMAAATGYSEFSQLSEELRAIPDPERVRRQSLHFDCDLILERTRLLQKTRTDGNMVNIMHTLRVGGDLLRNLGNIANPYVAAGMWWHVAGAASKSKHEKPAYATKLQDRHVIVIALAQCVCPR